MIFDFVIWNASPEIFSIGPLTIRWYGLMFALAFITGYKIMEYVYKKEKMPDAELDRVSMYMIIAVVVGARLGHVLFYQPEIYLAHPIEILKIWEGGLASHGAAIGILIALYIYSRKKVPSISVTINNDKFSSSHRSKYIVPSY
ncbi:MAG: prolipoprotein diacylglyceryl transferase, partial [Sphingobacteriales bacterium]